MRDERQIKNGQCTEALDMLYDLQTPERPPDDWEEEFLNSLESQIHRGRTLTEKQFWALKKVHARMLRVEED